MTYRRRHPPPPQQESWWTVLERGFCPSSQDCPPSLQKLGISRKQPAHPWPFSFKLSLPQLIWNLNTPQMCCLGILSSLLLPISPSWSHLRPTQTLLSGGSRQQHFNTLCHLEQRVLLGWQLHLPGWWRWWSIKCKCWGKRLFFQCLDKIRFVFWVNAPQGPFSIHLQWRNTAN